MKTINNHMRTMIVMAAFAALVGTGCTSQSASLVTGRTGTTTAASTAPGGGSVASNGSPAGGGAAAPVVLSATVPTADVIPGRIQNALTLPGQTTSLVSPAAGNFAAALAQQGPNLAITTNPNAATGGGAVPLVAYGACNDVNPASYNVNTGAALSAQAPNIVAAGVTIVNQCTAGLAAAGSTLNTQVSQIFTDLTTANEGTAPADAASYSPPLVAANPAATTAQAFIAVCTAATEFCVGMLSF